MVQPVGLAVLYAAGVGDLARDLGAPIRVMRGWAGQRLGLDVAYRDRNPGLALHRAALFHLLWTAATQAGVRLETGAPVVSAPQDGMLRWLQRGAASTLGPFDLVVDASGTGSPLSPLKARPLGFGAIWSQVPWPAETALPRDALSQRYFRAERMAGVLPLYARLRRWHLFSYQAMSAVLTPMYQSHRRALPVLRDHLLAPLARLPPVRRLLTSLVTGDLLPPMAGIAWPPQRSPARLPETAEGAT